VRAARNLAAATSPTSFELDPADHLAAEEEARALGLEVVGIWHSHPDQPPQPSRADEREAWHGWSFLIVAVDAHGLAELGSWRFVDGRFVAEPVRLRGSPVGATPGGPHWISAGP
jgi:proteasome lid subunit RPN8/RPN11